MIFYINITDVKIYVTVWLKFLLQMDVKQWKRKTVIKFHRYLFYSTVRYMFLEPELNLLHPIGLIRI